MLVVFTTSATGAYYYNRYSKIKKIISEYEIFYNMGDFRTAKEKMSEAVNLDPQNSDLWYYLGAIQSLAGNYDDGIESLLKANKIKEKNAYKILLTNFYLLGGNLDAAKKYSRDT